MDGVSAVNSKHSRKSRLKQFVVGALLCVTSVGAQVQYPLVKPEVIQARLDLYKGNDSHREIALKRLFGEAGCATPNLSEQAVPHRKQPNLLCLLPGNTPDTIVIGAHFDHVSDGDGIVDNWSGASLLPSLLQSLSGSRHRLTYLFVGFTGEEDGELGSKYFVDKLGQEERSRILLMVNLDTLGLGSSKVWASRSDKIALNLLEAIARAKGLPLGGVNLEEFGESDEESFIKAHICTITVHSLTNDTGSILHTPSDSPKAIRFKDYYDTYHLVAVYLNTIDIQPPGSTSSCAAKQN